MCGEHLVAIALSATWPGSSPHVRGAHIDTAAVDADFGIIPACAGSTEQYLRCVCVFWDHPRMCGEHVADILFFVDIQGSSPHVRGALPAGGGNSAIAGIIPACAGSTMRVAIPVRGNRDHPRMCGEHTSKIA